MEFTRRSEFTIVFIESGPLVAEVERENHLPIERMKKEVLTNSDLKSIYKDGLRPIKTGM